MFIPPVHVTHSRAGSRRPVARGRWIALLALTAVSLIVTGLQLTPAALLPPEKTARLAGVTIGLVFGSIALTIERRLRGDE